MEFGTHTLYRHQKAQTYRMMLAHRRFYGVGFCRLLTPMIESPILLATALLPLVGSLGPVACRPNSRGVNRQGRPALIAGTHVAPEREGFGCLYEPRGTLPASRLRACLKLKTDFGMPAVFCSPSFLDQEGPLAQIG